MRPWVGSIYLARYHHLSAARELGSQGKRLLFTIADNEADVAVVNPGCPWSEGRRMRRTVLSGKLGASASCP